MIAAIYVRVSTDAQREEGYSIDFQIDKLKSYCNANSYQIEDTFIDGGYSGSNMKRPALQSLISRIKEFDIVVVYKLDRLSRSQKDTLYLIEDVFIKNNVNFASISESLDTGSPFGLAMIGILSVFAQLERENIKQRMLSGRMQRAKEGLSNGQFNTCIGYRYVDGMLIKDEYEAQQILEAVDLYLKGIGSRKIESILNKKGYKTAYGSYKGSGNITMQIFNPILRGKVTFSGKEYPGKHEPIISEELYIKMLEQKVLRAKGSAFKREHLLSGLLWCEHCSGRVATKNLKNKLYYACYSATKSSRHMIKDPNCKLPKFDMQKLDSYVEYYIKNSYAKSNKIIKEHKKENKQTDTSLFENQIKKIDSQIKRLMDLYQFGEIEAHQIRDRINILNSEKDKLLERITEVIEYDYSGFKNILNILSRQWDDLDTEDKREYLMIIIDKILLNDKKEVKIIFKVGDING